MEFTNQQMPPEEMLVRIAELDHSNNQIKEANAQMSSWLDVADEEITTLRSENFKLKKKVTELTQAVRTAQQDQAVNQELGRSLLDDELDIKRCSEQKIWKLEQETIHLNEENKHLSAEIKNLELQQNQDKINLNKLKVSMQTLESEMEMAQAALQYRNEVIQKKFLELQHAEETLEEYSNVISDLRLTNQKLREQLNTSWDEASFALANDLMGVKDGHANPPLTFAEELEQLPSSFDVKASTPILREPKHEEAENNHLLHSQTPTVEPQTKRCAGVLKTPIHKLRRFWLGFLILIGLVFIISISSSGKLFSIDIIWSNALWVFEPYFHVHYGHIPPF